MNDQVVRVLVVDDDEDDFIVTRDVLFEIVGWRFEVEWAASYDAALEVIGPNQHDVYLVDYRLGARNGLELMREVLGNDRETPMILLTGQGDREIDIEAMKAGAADYLVKGRIDASLLERSIRYSIQRKRAEETKAKLEEQLLQSQKMESVGQLAGGVAHEFNNLLTSIMGFTQLVITGMDPGDAACSDLRAVLRSAERASKLSSQLLVFSRQHVCKPEVFDLNQLILNTGNLLRSIIDKDVELVILLAPAKNLVSADPDQIEQVLMNLVVNARDAMPTGGKIVIETTRLSVDQNQAEGWDCPPGRYVSLTVNDNGIGMSDEIRRKVFDPFFSTKETGKGTGLGLSICYGIMKQNGGHIEVDSEIGDGTTFKIYFPCSRQGVSAIPENQERKALPDGKETILLVEDESMIRSMCMRVLFDKGYKVLEAANGEEALRLTQNHAAGVIDLLLTDVVMPQMGGIELASRLHELRPDIKILLTSGYSEEAPTLAGSPTEIIPFLPKPFLPSALLSQVREVLDT